MKPQFDDAPAWERVEPPYQWKKYGLVVIGDRHLPNGRRQHIVIGSVAPGTTLDNADIFGEDDMVTNPDDPCG